eukprot:tig00021293_g19995.t1
MARVDRCPDCNDEIVQEANERVCSSCGLVVEEGVLHASLEFTKKERANGPDDKFNRVGTVVRNNDVNGGLRGARLSGPGVHSECERQAWRVKAALKRVDQLGSILGVSRRIKGRRAA